MAALCESFVDNDDDLHGESYKIEIVRNSDDDSAPLDLDLAKEEPESYEQPSKKLKVSHDSEADATSTITTVTEPASPEVPSAAPAGLVTTKKRKQQQRTTPAKRATVSKKADRTVKKKSTSPGKKNPRSKPTKKGTGKNPNKSAATASRRAGAQHEQDSGDDGGGDYFANDLDSCDGDREDLHGSDNSCFDSDALSAESDEDYCSRDKSKRDREVTYDDTPESPNGSSWSADLPENRTIPKFTGKAGLSLPKGTKSPIDIFHLVFPEDFFVHLTRETNRYAQVLTRRGEEGGKVGSGNANERQDSRFKEEWFDVTEHDMRGFFLLLLHMGTVKKHSVSSYWQTDSIFSLTPFAKEIMPRNRFFNILHALHVSNDDECKPEGHPEFDPLHKVRYVYEHLKKRFAFLYTPDHKVCVADSYCLIRGELSFKVGSGIKIRQLFEVSSAYVCGFEIFTDDKAVSNKPEDVCLRLMGPLLDQGYWLYTGKHYTSPALARKLFDRKTMTVGQADAEHKGLPRELMDYFLKDGESAFQCKEQLVCVKYRQFRSCRVLLSTVHDPTEMVSKVTTKSKQVKLRPRVLQDFRSNMVSTQSFMKIKAREQTTFHSVLTDTLNDAKKWWRKLLLHLLAMGISQCHALHVKLQGQLKQKSLSFPEFLACLGRELTDFHFSQSQAIYSQHNVVVVQPTAPSCVGGPVSRFHGKHFPSLLPSSMLTHNKPKFDARHCKVCADGYKRGQDSRRYPKTPYWCRDCEVPLCVDGCFEKYHTQDKYWL